MIDTALAAGTNNMTALPLSVVRRMRERLGALDLIKDGYYARTTLRRERVLAAVQEHRDEVLRSALSGLDADPWCQHTAAEITAYAKRCDWAVFDLMALAAGTEATIDQIARALAQPLIVYQAFRVVDDVLDHHVSYKGCFATSLGTLLDQGYVETAASGANLLLAMVMLTRALPGLPPQQLREVTRTLGGALAELGSGSTWDLGRYRSMVEGKMVSYGLLLYGPVLEFLAADVRQSVEPFLSRSFFVAQVLNDIGDVEEDAARGQPNFWQIADPATELFVAELDQLEESLTGVHPLVLPYAQSRYADLLRYGLHILDRSTRHQVSTAAR